MYVTSIAVDCFGIGQKQRSGPGAFPGGLFSHLIYFASLFNLVPNCLRLNMDRDHDVSLQATFQLLRDSTIGFFSGTSNVVKTHSSTPCQDVRSILTCLKSCLAALAPEPSIMTSSDP